MKVTFELTQEQVMALRLLGIEPLPLEEQVSNLWEPGSIGLPHSELSVKAIRSYARQLVWLAENDDGWRVNPREVGQFRFYVIENSNPWDCERLPYATSSAEHHYPINTIFMSERNAEKLAKALIEGEVVF